MKNPLLETDQLPLFDQIKPEHIEPALDLILAENREKIAELLQQDQYSWNNFIAPLETLNDRLQNMWSPVSHLNAVTNSTSLRKAYRACLPKLSSYFVELGQNKALYEAYQSIADSLQFQQLATAQQKSIHNELRDFHLSGITLNDKKKQRFQEISRELTQLTSQFSDNILDANNAWTRLIHDEKSLAGLPTHALASAAQAATEKKEEGYLLSLEFPCYQAVMTYAKDRTLRQEMYTAYVTRASDQGPSAGHWDNSPIIPQILQARQELAKLLGYANYVDYSLTTKMAESSQQILDFLIDLAERSLPQAKQELAELAIFAKKKEGLAELQPWDITYYSEQLKQHKHALADEALRPYFPINKVLTGMFEIAKRLYGIHIAELKNTACWHKDVQFFQIKNKEGHIQAQFYLDLYARKNKRGGAWMDECRSRRRLEDGTLQLPVAYLTCNFGAGIKGQSALLTHDEVITLFHEFGHGLHHMLTQIEYPEVSGINGVPWDGVELPSQFFENWCWQREALQCISGHYQTGESLPDELFDRVQQAKNFQSGLTMLRQIEFSLFDIYLHQELAIKTSTDVQKILDAVRKKYAVMPIVDFNRFQHGFSHIFAGGYAAGYYSYKWAEVLASDAFAKFEETGIFNEKTGGEFLHHILQKGGSEEFMTLFKAFRGREPSIEALLRHSGLIGSEKTCQAVTH